MIQTALVAHEYHDLIAQIFSDMAAKKRKPVERIKRLFFITKNRAIVQEFWDILDKHLPGHRFDGVWVCPHSGDFTLVEENAF